MTSSRDSVQFSFRAPLLDVVTQGFKSFTSREHIQFEQCVYHRVRNHSLRLMSETHKLDIQNYNFPCSFACDCNIWL
jgi:hypothetical protein